jgi:hypothetical protein
MPTSRSEWLFRNNSPEGRLMIRCTTFLPLAACLLAVPSAGAQQPGQDPQTQPRPTAVSRGSRPPAGVPNLTPRASTATSSGYGQDPGDQYEGPGGEGGYGKGGSTGGGDSPSPAASSAGSSRAVEVILKASGVPNRNGRVDWPLGLRLLRVDEQRQQLEAQLHLAAEQVTGGGVNPQLLDEIRASVEDLRQLLLADKEQRFSMPLATYEEAERFLGKLKKTPQILAASAPATRTDPTGR